MLAPHELTGSTWLKLKEHIEMRMDHLRKLNDGNLDMTETAALRGRIKELKNLLATAEPQPGPATAEEDV